MAGREATLRHLRETLREGSACVVAEAGMGKSTLLAQVAEALRGEGEMILHLRGTESMRSVPWGALRHSPLAPWLPDSVDAAAELAAEMERQLAPDVLVVDEVQSLDPASATWLRQVASTRAVPMLLAWRAGTLTDDGLLDALTAAGARTVALEGLLAHEVRALAEGQVGGPVADSLVRSLMVHTGGNPMLVRTSLAQWDGEGLLLRGPITRLGGEPTAPLPLTTAAAARVAALPPDLGDALLAVALAEPVPLDSLVALVPEEVLERCEVAGLIAIERRDGADLVLAGHPTLAQAAREGATQGRTEHVAARLLGLADPGVSGVQRGQWVLLAGSRVVGPDREAAETLTAAAEEARRFQDLHLAGQLARAARAAGAGIRADLVLAEIDMASGRWDHAESTLSGLADAATTDRERVLVANAHAYVLGQLGRSDDAWQVLDAASTAVAPEHRGALQVRAAINRLFEADARATLELCEPLLADNDLGTRGRACYAAAIALGLLGDASRAAEVADLGERAFAGRLPAPSVTQIGPAIAGILAGDLAEAERRARTLSDQMLAAGDREGEATGSFLLGRIALERADPGEAQRQFRASLAAAEEIGDPVAARWARGGLLHAVVLSRGAADPEASALAVALAAEAPSVRLFEDDVVVRALALHRATAGDRAGAVAMLRRAAEEAAHPRRAVAALLATDALLLPGAGDPAEASEPGRPCLGPPVRQPATRPDPDELAHALASSDLATLERIRESTRAAGAELCAGALAARVARALPPDSRDAALWRGRATAAGDLAPWRSTAATPARLSRRQQQVAELAARGLTSAQIAAELGLSTRTAENHLQQAYRTLGVRTRDELRAALDR